MFVEETLKKLVNGKPLPFKKLTASDVSGELSNPSGPEVLIFLIGMGFM